MGSSWTLAPAPLAAGSFFYAHQVRKKLTRATAAQSLLPRRSRSRLAPFKQVHTHLQPIEGVVCNGATGAGWKAPSIGLCDCRGQGYFTRTAIAKFRWAFQAGGQDANPN